MSRRVEIAVWLLLGLAGLGVLITGYTWAFPFYPERWETNRSEATTIALERFRDLGPLPQGAYVVARLDREAAFENRLVEAARAGALLTGSPLLDQVTKWEVTAYAAAARAGEWIYRGWVSVNGEVLGLHWKVPETEEGESLDFQQARAKADRVLTAAGFDRALFEEPEPRRNELANRTDLVLRYRYREQPLGPDLPHGIEVTFAGDRWTGFQPYLDDPDESGFQAQLQITGLMSLLRFLMPYLLFPWIAVAFLRRYHEGEIGVRRSLLLFALGLAAGAVLMVLSAAPAAENSIFGPLSRRLATWAFSLQLLILWISMLVLVGALCWSVGEARLRERRGHKLAAFDGLLHGDFGNATVARSSLRGVAAGLALAAVLLMLAPLVSRLGGKALFSFQLGPWYESAVWPGLALIGYAVLYTLFSELFGRLFLLPLAADRLGVWGAAFLVVVVSAVVFFPPIGVLPGGADLLFGGLLAAGLVLLFLRFDLLTTLLAAYTIQGAMGALPFLLSDDPFLKLQGSLPLVLAVVPLGLSLGGLSSRREFTYRYEDVPAHVRRIAERERQRVELETARRIQSSILPELPPQLAGVELASVYRPATEVGGDFYDVLALEDGRLALAVGDVAGHGVSSGLVMSMAKSALAVQVTFDPEVAAVLRTLNRTVYQAARRRLLTTLCYAVLDPVRRELVYASAGHIFPYVIGAAGQVRPLEALAYPLGVREDLQVEIHRVQLAPGDTVLLLSDGVVEARAEGSIDLYGFTRLEASLARHAGEGPRRLCAAILEEVTAFAGGAPREDDQTLLVARLPAG
jgi:hypothetical protein